MVTSSRSRVRASDGPAWLELPVFSACVTWSSLTVLHHAACVVAAGVDVFTPNDKLLVKDLNFSLELGGSLLLTGHNGAGKSSIFRCLGGLWNVPTGKITKPGGKAESLSKSVFYL